MFKFIKRRIKRKKRLAFIEERLKLLRDIKDCYTVLTEFNIELMKEYISNSDKFDGLLKAENKSFRMMFDIDNEIDQLEKEERELLS